MKNRSTITAVCLVKNEERWIWFTLMSVLEHVDEIIIGDTGSTDRTIEAIQSIKSPKIHFTDYGGSSNTQFTQYRQQQIDAATSEWVMILDGDELWTPPQLAELHTSLAASTEKQIVVVSRFYNCIGDIFHYQDDKYSGYRIWDIKGNVTPRLFNKKRINGLRCDRPYGAEGYSDALGKDIVMEATREEGILLENRYLHTTFLTRANTLLGDWKIPYRRGKFLNVRGVHRFPASFVYPESFTHPERPQWIAKPDSRRSLLFFALFIPASHLAYLAWKIKSALSRAR